jgi:hypothetical protein
MLTALVDSALADFIRRRVAFSHHDIAERIPGLLPSRTEEVRQMVFERMIRLPEYRLSVAHFVGEGLTLMCIPRDPSDDSHTLVGECLVSRSEIQRS